MNRTQRTLALLAIAALAGTTAGCASGAESGPVTIEYAAWGNVDKVVDLWNETHPDVQVKLTEVTGGDDAYQSYRASIAAGKAPDVISIEYQEIVSFVADGALLDITPYVSDVKDEFADWTWESVSPGGTTYGVPGDSGPVAFAYNTEVFDQFGLDVPTTWAEYRAAGEKLHAADPSRVLGSLQPDGVPFAALSWQNGAKWFGNDGDAWTVSIDAPETTKVSDYWGALLQDGLVSPDAPWSPEWFSRLDSGKVASVISPAWMPKILSTNLTATSGKWRVVPLPQWEASEASTGNMGGSATAVTADSKHPKEAAEFAKWLGSSPDAVELLVNDLGIFPASLAGLESDALEQSDPFFGGQKVFEVYKQIANDVDTSWTWAPATRAAFNAVAEAIGRAAESGTALTDELVGAQEATEDAMRTAGFNVAD